MTSERIDLWVKRLYYFDHWTEYSDDHSVWRQGVENKQKLRAELQQANLTAEEKQTILARVGVLSDDRYKESLAKYSCIAERPLWDEGEGPELKRVIRGYLSC